MSAARLILATVTFVVALVTVGTILVFGFVNILEPFQQAGVGSTPASLGWPDVGTSLLGWVGASALGSTLHPVVDGGVVDGDQRVGLVAVQAERNVQETVGRRHLAVLVALPLPDPDDLPVVGPHEVLRRDVHNLPAPQPAASCKQERGVHLRVVGVAVVEERTNLALGQPDALSVSGVVVFQPHLSTLQR